MRVSVKKEYHLAYWQLSKEKRSVTFKFSFILRVWMNNRVERIRTPIGQNEARFKNADSIGLEDRIVSFVFAHPGHV